MALHKVCELEGALLDAAVAKAEGAEVRMEGGEIIEVWWPTKPGQICWAQWSPRTSWAQGGPIIGRERIGFQHHAFRVGHETHNTVDAFLPGRHHQSGPTMLIAAMRAFVASHFGEEVEL